MPDARVLGAMAVAVGAIVLSGTIWMAARGGPPPADLLTSVVNSGRHALQPHAAGC